MRKIDSIEDELRGVMTFEFDNGQRVCVSAKAVQMDGIEQVLRDAGLGHLIPSGRLPLKWHGERVGTVLATFDPVMIRSRSFMYEPRPGDFVRDADGWTASSALGPGDLEAVPGFVWDNPPERPAMIDNSEIVEAVFRTSPTPGGEQA